MVETASWLGDIDNKTILLTGALQPAAFTNTDAVFNVGCAIGALQSREAGVYIAMNGQVFAADQVVKNRAENRFETASK
jgi:L-asparaginase